MIYRVEIRSKNSFGDPHADMVHHQIGELGMESVIGVRSARLFFLIGQLTEVDAERIADELLTDPVIEEYSVGSSGQPEDAALIEVHLKAGVMDPVAASAVKAVTDMGLPIEGIRTARRYELLGDVNDEQKRKVAVKLLANAVIEDMYFEDHTPLEMSAHSYDFEVIEVPIRDLDDEALMKLSVDGDMFLNITEMKAIQDYFKSLGREARDVELEMIAQTWSEHCGHKTFRSDVVVRNNAGEIVEEIPNLLKNTVFGSTNELNKPWCLNVFEDNAGVIEFDETHAVCFKVETHNHPSAIEPYGGAATGIGGVVRDPMGTGLGASPVANTDVFCFGPTDMPLDDVPKGVLHPRRVMRRVVAGVRDYGNRMGIPTVNGAVYFDKRYLGNPLVYCGTIGMLPADKCTKRQPAPGDAIICVGGRTGRDGIHGATFSSGELTHEHETEFSHAVQIGNAITEKKVLDTIMQARDLDLYSSITDCGAGGLSSAVGEMGEQIGAEVHIDRVPLKYDGLTYSEIWISEAQERMVLAVPPENVERILKIFADEDVDATVIGTYGTENRKLRLFYDSTEVLELDMEFLHDGLPRPTKEAIYEKVDTPSPTPPQRDDYTQTLLNILASPNVASKEWIIRQYDHEVQGGSVIKPLVGVTEDGPGDAAVVRPVLESSKGVVISCGMNPHLGDLDPYQSALHAVDEALRNSIAVGGNLERTAILDNFCWGNCNKPDRMGTFVQAAKACYDAAMAYQTPFVSGKDSLNNEFQTDTGETIAIPSTLLISAMSVVDDAAKCVTADAKEAGNSMFLLGETSGKLGGSHYLLVEGLETGNDVPEVDPTANRKLMLTLQKAIEDGIVRSCHDLSEGGLAAAAAEMAFSGGMGVELQLDNNTTASEQAQLFGEDAGRFLVEVTAENRDAFAEAVKDLPAAEIGKVTDTGQVVIRGDSGTLINTPIEAAKEAWQGTFDW
ncbi:MAG: phosphoribosylformylglycinamidine synthase subunit PurL [Phycisphaerae bacterium]|jgi:phosphoribosylformylglycinamidine synthase|nr:phosphoribosylformylglycinamidine synthase subunit PurL [Phycisphaerae bacterium]